MIELALQTFTDRDVEQISQDPPPWNRRAVLHQRWSELAYFHWPYEPAVVQRLLPAGVRIDTFDGAAWVGLIPFEMRDVQFGRTPPMRRLGSFIEVNVRTYVIDALGRRAVWFFSLDVPRSAAVVVARSAFGLPYCWARAEHSIVGDRHHYQTQRRWPAGTQAGADIRFRVSGRVADSETGALDHFLYARWAMVAERRHQLSYGRVDHPRWPLHRVDAVEIDETLIKAAGLPAPDRAPHAHYSPGVDVRIAWYEKIAAVP
ncbi:MAG: DUF2071 domain-containing protein [Ilumatobacteraceae bacterium]